MNQVLSGWLENRKIAKLKLLTALGVLLLALGLTTTSADALTINSGRDFDSNAVMNGGCLSTEECQQKFKGCGLVPLFNRFGISHQDMRRLGTTAKAGHVTSDGAVWVGGRIVATNATTAGRHNIAGSTAIKAGCKTFYMRSTSVSFASSPLPAFVVMKDGQFDFAILSSCGNPVIAKPVPKEVTKPKPQPKPTPPQVITIVTPPPPPPQILPVVTPPAPAPAPAPQPQQLPKSGPSDVLSLGVFTAVAGTIGHYLYRRYKLN
jgi:hypothetical protein